MAASSNASLLGKWCSTPPLLIAADLATSSIVRASAPSSAMIRVTDWRIAVFDALRCCAAPEARTRAPVLLTSLISPSPTDQTVGSYSIHDSGHAVACQ